ncbi:NAD(P)-dependent dehydrogenase (short-subunit alcohol dehydrogenase family) [Ancylobacter aquaticus]|uniref:NAD(P)-dependent dehydrogenase (Short-subunit alcohol dehydrogenase family) n=1 Tax=Ancylobacter aquaticus TaxID=100 RepID=A0A4R1I159_ANCAQ|nr:SDR family oxidoreductase [Ancylobacter aquaticus]TCK28907.1 NAD(P)-dependent dehydrogenase (short-subunit alcohol dehydrogenase family) [Ancylobacter aquaticus]
MTLPASPPAPDRSPASARPVALVTGGAVRIGRAISLRLAEEGYDIALHVRRAGPAAEETRAAIRETGARAAVIVAELADAGAVDAVIPTVVAALGPLSLLVNNASEFHPDTVEALDLAVWERHMAVNLRAPVQLARAFAAQLPEGASGAIVNLIDQRVLKPTPAYFSYSVTKEALWAATRMLAQALAPRVRVNGVGPGPTLANERQGADAFARQSASMLLGHGPSPEEIADAVAYLARASSVTGQMIAVDGGQHLAWRTPDVEDD